MTPDKPMTAQRVYELYKAAAEASRVAKPGNLGKLSKATKALNKGLQELPADQLDELYDLIPGIVKEGKT